MTGHDMVGSSAAEVPTPGPGDADPTVAQGHRARLRRGAAALGAGLGLVTVVVAAAMVAPAAPGDNSESGATRSAEAAVYATAIKALADEVSAGGPPVLVVYVLDQTCADVEVRIMDGACDPQSLSDSLREELAADLASYAPVQYITDGRDVTDANLDVIDGGVVVALGPVRISGDDAHVPLAVRRGGLNGRGVTYVLRHSGQTWHVDRASGTQWIS